MNSDTCSICGRVLGTVWNEHHLIPKTFKGSETVALHKICHNAIHAAFSERELQHHFHTIERLLGDGRIDKFVAWVKKKPIDFYEKTRDSKAKKRKRR